MPTVALFAQRDIEENEELTYDYNLNRPETKKVKRRRKKGNNPAVLSPLRLINQAVLKIWSFNSVPSVENMHFL